jgi:hypothetical protein
MKKILIIIFLLNNSFGFSQCPTLPVELLSQADVNAFPVNYPGCSNLPDGIDLKIMGADIVDLTPLLGLSSSNGIIEIRNCPILTSLNGLQNIHRIGNDILDGFILRDLPMLTDISALNSVDSIHGEFTIRTCASLVNLNGLNNLKYVNGSVIIRNNQSLINLSGLDSLTFIGETLELVDNIVLTDIQSLKNVDTIVGGIEGGVFIEGNTQLTSLIGLGSSATIIGSNLDIMLNGNLTLCSVPSICNYLSNPPLGAVITISANGIGCNSQTEIENGCLSLSVENTNTLVDIFLVNSNIVKDEITIYSNKKLDILIVDTTGKFIVSELNAGQNIINVSGLASGMCFIKNQNKSAIKFVKI